MRFALRRNGAGLRELSEETSLRATAVTPVGSAADDADQTDYFLIRDAAGGPQLGGPEAQRNRPGNRYELRWIPIAEVETVPLRPPTAYDMIKKAYGTVRRNRDA